jgi:hypothetical protein
LILAIALLAFTHPNPLAHLPEPTIQMPTDLSITLLAKESPQFAIWYTGGIVGYFSNEWDAPVWTTPAAGQVKEYDEPERVYLPPNYGPPVVVNPPDCPPDPVPVQTPEPGTWALVGAALMTLAFIGPTGRRKRHI